MQFDSNLAWKEASAAVRSNREVLLALAGVFFLLPSLATALLFPQPQAAPEMTSAQAMAMAREYYVSAMPFLLPMTIIQAAGTLGMLALFTDRSRPTVQEAIRLGFIGLLPYIAAQLLLGIGVALTGGLLYSIAAATGIRALALIVGALVAFAIFYLAIRTSVTAPTIIVEGQRNPIAALKRSWALTRGNTLKLGMFYLLLGIAFIVIIMVVASIVGTVVALLAGAETERVVSAVVSSALGAAMTLYFVAAIAAVHRQLARSATDTFRARTD